MQRALFLFAVFIIILPISASAHWNRHGNDNPRHHSHRTTKPQETPKPPTTTPVPPPPQNVPTGSEKQIQAYITGYSYYDNTPPGSADISNPVIHSKAGGAGTFGDPTTIAVGHVITGSTDKLDYAPGTVFYIPDLRHYFIVEDACGDGGSPQNGPCHTGYQGHPWLDIWVGKGASKSASDACMNKITDIHEVIINPTPNYPVVVGDIAADCALY